MSNFSNKISTATLVLIDGMPSEPGLYVYDDSWPWSVEMADGKLIAFQLRKGQLTGHTCPAAGLQNRHWQRLTWPGVNLDNTCLGWDITGWDLLDEVPSDSDFYLFITEEKPPQIVCRGTTDACIECSTSVHKSGFMPLSESKLKMGRWAKFNPKTAMSARCWQCVRAKLSRRDMPKFLLDKSGFFLRKNLEGKLYLAKISNGTILHYSTGHPKGIWISNRIIGYDCYKQGEWFRLQVGDGHNAFWLAGYRRGVMGLPVTDSNLEQNQYYVRGYRNGLYYLNLARGETLAESLKNASQEKSKRITDKQARSMRALFNIPEPRST